MSVGHTSQRVIYYTHTGLESPEVTLRSYAVGHGEAAQQTHDWSDTISCQNAIGRHRVSQKGHTNFEDIELKASRPGIGAVLG